MAEPVSSGTTTVVAAMASTAILPALRSQLDLWLVLGVICGGFLYLARSTEPSHLRKFIYFGVSLIGGYSTSQYLLGRWPWLPVWWTGCGVSAVIVEATGRVLDWINVNIGPTLDAFRAWALAKLPGGKNDDPQ